MIARWTRSSGCITMLVFAATMWCVPAFGQGFDPGGEFPLNPNIEILWNGERFDFRELPEGAVLPASAVACEFVVGDVMRLNGDLIITLLLPCGPEASNSACFPADIVAPPNGNVSLPL